MQQGSISEWRRGVFTPLPSLHLASPQPRLGRQLQVSAYWVWQHENWPSAAIVSLRTTTEQAYKHTDICSSPFFFLPTPYPIVPPAPAFQANTLLGCVRLTTETLGVAESPLLVFTALSLCQSHPNASDACRACPLCVYACLAHAYVWFFVPACECVYS